MAYVKQFAEEGHSAEGEEPLSLAQIQAKVAEQRANPNPNPNPDPNPNPNPIPIPNPDPNPNQVAEQRAEQERVRRTLANEVIIGMYQVALIPPLDLP